MASPYLIPSRPSRSVLRDLQLRLDSFLKILLRHPTFSMHELVWEFFLVPDIDTAMLAQRSARKAELRVERLREEYAPIYDVREVELFVQHARENVRSLHHASKSVLRRTNKLRMSATDLNDAAKLSNTAVHSLTFLPDSHLRAFERFTKTLATSEASPVAGFYYNMHALSSTITAVLTSLTRPSNLINSMSSTQKTIDRHDLSVRRSDRWPLGLLDDARSRVQRDAQEKMDRSKADLADLGRELKYTQQVVASELASWQESRVEMGRKALRELARRMVVTERARLESMRRAVRGLGLGEGRNKKAQGSGKGVNGKAVNGKAVEPAPAAGPSAQPDHVRETAHGESNGAAVAPSTSQDLDAATLPPQDKPGVEDLVDGPSDEPEEEDPLLDLAAEAPERLDGTAAPATAAAEEGEGVEDGGDGGEGEDEAAPLLPPRARDTREHVEE